MITMSKEVLTQIKEHGEQAYPEEGAGLLLGRVDGNNRFVDQILPQSNQFEREHRNRRYMITPQDLIRAEEIAEELGMELIGIFHSHPDHPAKPSDFDQERALPWFSYLITSVQKKIAHESRSWQLTDERRFIEEKVKIEGSSILEEV